MVSLSTYAKMLPATQRQCPFNSVQVKIRFKAVVGGTAGPAMAVPLFSRACNNIVL